MSANRPKEKRDAFDLYIKQINRLYDMPRKVRRQIAREQAKRHLIRIRDERDQNPGTGSSESAT
jgi:hypothetical protein